MQEHVGHPLTRLRVNLLGGAVKTKEEISVTIYDIAIAISDIIEHTTAQRHLALSPRAVHSPNNGDARLHPSKPIRVITKIAIMV